MASHSRLAFQGRTIEPPNPCIAGTGPGTGVGCVQGTGGTFAGITGLGPILDFVDPCRFLEPGSAAWRVCVGLQDLVPGGVEPCSPGFVKNANGDCVVLVGPGTPTSTCPPGQIPCSVTPSGCCVVTNGGTRADPTPLGRTPGDARGTFPSPSQHANVHLHCPPAANGKTGILYESIQTGEIVCVPRSITAAVALKEYGLVRKNKKQEPAIFTAADGRAVKKGRAIQTRIATLAHSIDAVPSHHHHHSR